MPREVQSGNNAVGLVVFAVLFYAGLCARHLTWRPFGLFFFLIVPGTAIFDYQIVRGAARLGEDQSFRWHPLVFSLDVLTTFLLWSVIYLSGYFVARLWRLKAKEKGRSMNSVRSFWIACVYELAAFATFVTLTFFSGYSYTWWNWVIAVPINIFLAEIWPIYWLILRPLFG